MFTVITDFRANCGLWPRRGIRSDGPLNPNASQVRSFAQIIDMCETFSIFFGIGMKILCEGKQFVVD
jgi:hypothetical protein